MSLTAIKTEKHNKKIYNCVCNQHFELLIRSVAQFIKHERWVALVWHLDAAGGSSPVRLKEFVFVYDLHTNHCNNIPFYIF